MRALCLIPPATFSKNLPVSASFRLPPNTYEVHLALIVAPAMAESPRFRGSGEIRFRNGIGNFADSEMSGGGSIGEPGAEPGGIAGESPSVLPDECAMIDFEQRDSPLWGVSVPAGAEFVRVTIIPEAGNNGGAIWCGAVVIAYDESGNPLEIDPSTRGS